MDTNINTKVKSIKFSKTREPDFIQTLRARVNSYFEEKKLSKNGDRYMLLKTFFMFSLFLVPYVLMITQVFSGTVPFFLLWITMGFGMAGIGLSIMHDANHSSYSKKPRINKLLGYTLNLLGGNSFLWRIQHNYLHHGFTNIDDADDDINVPAFLRFSPNAKSRPIQRLQHFYVWFFYGISTLSWVSTKNFLQFYRYYKQGLIKDKSEFRREMRNEIIWKLFYYFLFIALPVIILPVSAWLIVIAFFVMHLCIGISLSLVFQPAHVMVTSEFSLPDDNGNMENSWAIHQMVNTCNYAPKNRMLSWFIGGLNFQVEHHLFPNICHIHYKQISKIVKQTAAEYDIPYNSQPSFTKAILYHYKMIKALGRSDKINSRIDYARA